jgi:hypothetical protein
LITTEFLGDFEAEEVGVFLSADFKGVLAFSARIPLKIEERPPSAP